MNLDVYLSQGRTRVDAALDRLLPASDGPAQTLARAMRHAVQAGGKRLRPILTLAAHEACNEGECSDDILEPAAAVELMHTYSLIHDDLPAMDDDDLRRGQPTVHRAYGEAVAILAGDALQTLAFEVLGARPAGDEYAAARSDAVHTLARCAGINGMAGGQIADLEAEGQPAQAERLMWIHRHKTAAMFAASARIGAILARADPGRQDALDSYGSRIGLAFQIADDILDCTATAQTLGKTPGKDIAASKATYPALFGLEESRCKANELALEATSVLEASGLLTGPLEALAGYAVRRSR